MLTIRRPGHEAHRCRTVASGVRTLFGRDAVTTGGNRLSNNSTEYTVVSSRKKHGAHEVLGRVIVDRG